MKYSQAFIPTLKETPSDADTISLKLMLRAGLIRKLSSGIYEWLPLGLRVLKNVEHIIREEMDKIGGLELLLPAILPKEIWKETGRWDIYGNELFRIKDRKDAEFCLGPTHEEIITDIVRKDVRSYKQLPLMLYQFQTKFRDEIRPRFGVMRAKEFYMKDAYSFHATEEDAENYYKIVHGAYSKICERCGFKFRAVEATTGAIGGSFSDEFMVMADTGEEEIVSCECGYGANVEKAGTVPERGLSQKNSELKALEEVHTPNLKTVEEVGKFLNEKQEKFIKTLIYLADEKPVMVLVRGDCEINEDKFKSHLKSNELVLAAGEIVEKISGAPIGFAGPVHLPLTTYHLPLIADFSVENIINGISGANKKDYHLKNINIGRDYKPTEILDIRKIKKGDLCPRCKKHELKFSRGIEVGHTFKLGTKYSKAMNATFLDEKGKQNFFIMGCYGIGVSRIVAAAIEQSHDESGIIWNESLAPYKAIIIPVSYEGKIKDVCDGLYEKLSQKYDVLLDDRDERAGVKFKDADLLGIPVRITVSEKTLKENKVEIKYRNKNSVNLLDIEKVLDRII
ncbi:MAG: proline--tRNA ligase [Elusimicrobia bacterium HGW-Elusimicrobia-4]|nr:MAG: proline--tRNA ligase [Elusimicrobia bacterium HGW-Elusimicrobia-4]